MSRINLLAIYSKEITFLYNFFLSTLLSNHVATAKAAVRGGQAAVGQAAKGRRRVLGSTVGSCADQPSALVPINRRLDHL
jgi:hypothetical protein